MPKWLQQELPDIKKSTAAAWIYRRYDISLRDFLKITLSGIGLLLITADIFYHNLLAAAVLCPYLHFRLKIKSGELHKQRRERLKMQFKDGMQSVVFFFKFRVLHRKCVERSNCGNASFIWGKQ